MLVAGRRQVSQIVVINWISFAPELIDHRLHVHGIPDHDGISGQVQATGLIVLFNFCLASDLAFIGDRKEPTEGVQGLALVELRVDPSPEVPTFDVAQDEDGLDQPTVLLESPCQRILAGVGMEFADQQ